MADKKVVIDLADTGATKEMPDMVKAKMLGRYMDKRQDKRNIDRERRGKEERGEITKEVQKTFDRHGHKFTNPGDYVKYRLGKDAYNKYMEKRYG